MGKNIIVSEETLRDLLEAHASLSAWYYELWAGLRAANVTVHTPDDAARAAFVERLAADFPEIAAVARSIKVPRLYVPAPPPYMLQQNAPPQAGSQASPGPREEPATVLEPSQARAKAASTEAEAIAPPPMVQPGAVKYER